MNIKDELLKGNQNLQELIDKDQKLKDTAESLYEDGQHPYALIITCSDSRVVPELLFDKWLGELFVIRTAGNVINAGELATIEYAIAHLRIKYIVVLGHTSCGAVHAAIHKEKGQYLDPILSRIQLAIQDECDECKATKINADAQVKYIKEKFPQYDGEVVSMIYNVKDNKVI